MRKEALVLLSIFIILINAAGVSAQSIQLGQAYGYTFENLKEDIESCKEDAKNEQELFIHGYDLWGQGELRGYRRYEGARIGVYDCRNKGIDVFRLDMPSPLEDIYTSRKLSIDNSYLGEINVYYDVENAKSF